MTRRRSIRRPPRPELSCRHARARRSWPAAAGRRCRSVRGGTGRRAAARAPPRIRTAARARCGRGPRPPRPVAGTPANEWTKYRSAPSAMPSNSGCSRVRSTWFQPMCGRVGASCEPGRAAREDAEGGRAVLVAAVEQQLEPEADAQERPIPLDPVADRVDQAGPRQARHRRRRGPDARHDQRVGVPQAALVARHGDGGADSGQRLLDAHEVARPVVDDRDPRAVRSRRRSPERSLRGRHPVPARVRLAGGPQRAGEGLERGLGQVMVVAARAAQVERRPARSGRTTRARARPAAAAAPRPARRGTAGR